MRLKQQEIDTIKKETQKLFHNAKIYLFGSRVDDNKKGGDIDLYIIPQNLTNSFQKKLQLQASLEYLLHKPIDIIIAKDSTRLIEQEALENGLLL